MKKKSKKQPYTKVDVEKKRLLARNTELKMISIQSEVKLLSIRANALNKEYAQLSQQLVAQYSDLKSLMGVEEGKDINLETGEIYERKQVS